MIDEADRMIIQGSLPELEQIFEKIQEANPSLEYMQKHHADNDYDSDSDDDDRMMGLPGIRGEAKLMMLNDDLLKMIEKQNGNDPEVPRPDDDDGDDDEADDDDDVDDDEAADDSDAEDDVPEPMEMDDDEFEAEQAKLQHELERMDEDDSHDEKEEKEEPVKRQTFLFSATLTLPSSSHHSIDTSQSTKGEKGKGKDKGKDKGQFGKISVDGATSIAEILEKVGAQGQTKVVDLSTSGQTVSSIKSDAEKGDKNTKQKAVPAANPSIKLPPGLSFYELQCTQMHKDSHLYSFLTTTKQGSSGPCLVFCNAVGAIKRVAETLKALGLPVKTLHAQMQQKARLASLESFNNSDSRSVVVATDVAARGLDIPSVASPRSFSTMLREVLTRLSTVLVVQREVLGRTQSVVVYLSCW